MLYDWSVSPIRFGLIRRTDGCMIVCVCIGSNASNATQAQTQVSTRGRPQEAGSRVPPDLRDHQLLGSNLVNPPTEVQAMARRCTEGLLYVFMNCFHGFSLCVFCVHPPPFLVSKRLSLLAADKASKSAFLGGSTLPPVKCAGSFGLMPQEICNRLLFPGVELLPELRCPRATFLS